MKAIYRLTGSIFLTFVLLLPTVVAALELPDFRQIVRESSPAVVKIIVEHSAARSAQGQPGPEEIPEYLRRFF